MIQVVLLGAAGRMGRAVREAAGSHTALAIKACVDRAENLGGPAGVWRASLEEIVEPGDVVVEFSTPAACLEAALLCAERGAALVSGSTGLSAEDEAAVRAAASRVAVVRAANFSLGLAILRRAVTAALEALPRNWDVEIVERHHRNKLDSPSGTALLLAADVALARGFGPASVRSGRTGHTGVRGDAEVGVASVRGGSWVGDHEVLLAGESEWLELRHVASERGAFAHGALAAARFAAGAPAGLHSMSDVAAGATGFRDG
ncbi:MAG: 4-hydroxy-tetrahydrodipicolinate reductase [Candidatus Eisenbacteria bacterium]